MKNRGTIHGSGRREKAISGTGIARLEGKQALANNGTPHLEPPTVALPSEYRGSREGIMLASLHRSCPATRRRRPSALAALLLVTILGWWLAVPLAARAQTGAGAGVLTSFPIPNGYYFSEAAGDDPSQGYTISNDGGIPFWDAFRRLGGIDGLGFPSTGRFVWNGFVDQATQKAVLQWNPSAGQVELVNVFDAMEQLGLDSWLQTQKQTPPVFDNGADAGKSWPQIVARHQAELDWNPAIRARYFADTDALAHFGLPQSYADEGNVLVVRCQRAVFQQWKQNVPWAHAGEVTIANGGDIAKEAHLLPGDAATTVAAAGLIVAPVGTALPLSTEQLAAVRAAAATIRPSLTLVSVALADGGFGFGSGVVIDAQGLILTDAHVVHNAKEIRVTLADGRTLTAQLVGKDTLADVAVLRIPLTGLPAATYGGAAALQPSALVAATGFSDYFPSPPTVRAGQIIVVQQEPIGSTLEDKIASTLFVLPGDSGGPVVDMQDRLVALVQATDFPEVQGVTVSISIDNGLDSVAPIIRQIVATGQSIIRPLPGFDVVTMTAAIAKQLGLPLVTGMLIVQVDQDSAAAKAGIIAGDVVTAMDGTPTPSVAAYAAVLARRQPGDRVAVTYVDPKGGLHTVIVTLVGV